MNDPHRKPLVESPSLSTSGAARRDAVLASLQLEMGRLHRARRARRRVAMVAIPAFILAGIAWLNWPQRAPDANPLVADSGSGAQTIGELQQPTARSSPAVRIVLVETDGSTLERLRANPQPSAVRLSDADLLAALAAIDRPAGLMRSGDRAWLTRNVADDVSARGG